MKQISYFVAFILFICVATQTVAKDNYAATTADRQNAVASVNPVATQAGIDAFNQGGSAIDAALATAFALGVVDSHNSGIGGGCFILVRWANGRVEAIDGREMAPAAAHADMYLRNGKVDKSLSKTGPLAVGIPGSVAAMEYLHQQGGKLDWKDTILPAAKIAEGGFSIDKTLASRIASNHEALARYSNIFFDEEGHPLKAGDQLVQKDLASTYRKLAKKGSQFFYGESFLGLQLFGSTFAEKTVAWMKQNGGIVTQQDFENYEIKLRDHIKSSYKNFTVYGFPPPSSGGIHIAQALNILSHFEFTKMQEPERLQLLVEVMKRVFADRAYWLGDADFADVPKGLIGQQYAKSLAEKISSGKNVVVESHGTPPNAKTELFNKHTTHISAVDKAGNWVAITTTLNTSFGSKVLIPGTGVLLNNQMDDFAAQPGVPNAYGLIGAQANRIQPGKRPLSSMSPTIVEKNGEGVLTLGAAGGPTIITQVLQVLLNVMALDLSLEDAMAATRVHHQWKPDRIFIDGFAAPESRNYLEQKGYMVKTWPAFGATTGIIKIQEGLVPVTEPRLIQRNQ